MGKAGRERVERHYSVEAGAALWLDRLRHTAPHRVAS